MTSPTLATLRRYAISRSLFTPTTLPEAIWRLGFVQADPIRAPARAQDLILRLRVKNYRDGDLERRYPKLDVEEDVLVNYGFLPRQHQQWLHPRQFEGNTRAEHHAPELAEAVLSHVLEHGPTHPRDLEAKLGSQTYANYWGGRSNATTGLLDSLHYRGQLRVVRRDKGTRVYGPAKLAHLAELGLSPEQQLAGAARLILALYAPLPEASFKQLLQMLRYGAPQLRHLLKSKSDWVRRWQDEGWLAMIELEGTRWLLPQAEDMAGSIRQQVRLLAPFDPIVWDRRRFALFWGWDYRLEAYTPPEKRQFGYYALPVLWADQVIGWANLKQNAGRLDAQLGHAQTIKRQANFEQALGVELERFARFLELEGVGKVEMA